MNKEERESSFDLETDSELSLNLMKNIEEILSDDEMMDKDSSVEEMKKVTDEMKAETGDTITNDANATETEAGEADSKNELTSTEKNTEDNSKDNTEDEEKLDKKNALKGQGDELEEDLDEQIDDELVSINASLAKQISDEIDQNNIEEQSKPRKIFNLFTKVQFGFMVGIVSFLCIGLFLTFTKPGNAMLMKMGINLSGKIWATWTNEFEKVDKPNTNTAKAEEKDETEQPEVADNKYKFPVRPGAGRHEDYAYNILLLGEEAIGSGSHRGRTDVIVIASINTRDKKIVLTSLMRDTLVKIPGYQDNKLNSAYEKGGIDLLYETIQMNFNIKLDGCAMVNFENFEKIIDRLGGLNIKLTEAEAKYLNRTNYISKPQYRKVVPGTQLMNGNQVLGYSRIRYRAAVTGKNNDYGRTDRHRIILNAIFEKYKTKNKLELIKMMPGLLPMITTDIESQGFELLLNAFLELGTVEIEQLRIPADGTFTDKIEVRGMDVLIPNYEENIKILHDQIFGEEMKETDTVVSNEDIYYVNPQ